MKRHDIDVTSLMAGLLFAALAAVFALHALDIFDVDLRAAPAVALIVAGLGGITAALTSARADDITETAGSETAGPVPPDRVGQP
jgi:hypothetical protein